MACDPFWSQTVLACHFEGANGSTTFVNEHGGNLTPVGTAQISTAQSKVGTSSAYFDGASGYLTGSNADLNLDASDFTIEMWVYPVARLQTYPALFSNYNAFGTGSLSFFAGHNSSVTTKYQVASNGSFPILTSTSTIVYGAWVHIALVRSSDTLTLYINGVAEASTSVAGVTYTGGGTSFAIGNTLDSAVGKFNGYIDNVRITKVARYTSNFTPDTSPFLTNQCAISGKISNAAGNPAKRIVRAFRRDTAALIATTVSDAVTGAYNIPTTYLGEYFVLAHDGDLAPYDPLWQNTSLLCHFDGADGSKTFTDEIGHVFTAYGDAKISTTQSKFGGSSAYFDGTGDWITTPNVSDFDLSSGVFTIEAWIYNTGPGNYRGIIGARPNGAGQGWCLYVSTGNVLTFGAVLLGTGYGDRSLGISVPSNQWVHVALVKTATQYVGYVNGVAGTPVVWAGGLHYVSTQPLIIGALGSQGELPFVGYIDEVRITKGVVRYTSNFTPETSPFLGKPVIPAGAENASVLDRILPV